MVDIVERAGGRILGPRRGKRLHRKRDMDHCRGAGDDFAHRIVKKRLNQRLWPNYSKSQYHSVAGNAYIELLLVLPVLVVVFLGLATVASLFMGNVAVSQAAEQGVLAWSTGDSTSAVGQVVNTALAQQGYRGTAPTTTFVASGNMKTLTVSVPMKVLNLGTLSTVSSSRSITTVAPQSVSPSPAPAPTSGGGGGSHQGGGGTVYHHFPMW